jgi:hypothetical protein
VPDYRALTLKVRASRFGPVNLSLTDTTFRAEPTELQSNIQMRQGFEEEFNAVLNDVLTLQKSDGRVYEKIKAHVSPKGILIMDVQLPIEAGDNLIRTLPEWTKRRVHRG